VEKEIKELGWCLFFLFINYVIQMSIFIPRILAIQYYILVGCRIYIFIYDVIFYYIVDVIFKYFKPSRQNSKTKD